MTASMSTVTIPLLRETNLPELSGPAICFMNFSFYLAVAFFGNLTGFLMNAFPPEVRNGAFVYGRASWLTVFAVLAAFAPSSAAQCGCARPGASCLRRADAVAADQLVRNERAARKRLSAEPRIQRIRDRRSQCRVIL